MTEAKLDLEALSRDTLTAAISELQEDEARPFHRAVFHVDEVMAAVAERTSRKNTRRTIELALKRLGATRIPHGRITLTLGKGRKVLWTWRNHEKWLVASPEELRAEWDGGTAVRSLLPEAIREAVERATLPTCQVSSPPASQ